MKRSPLETISLVLVSLASGVFLGATVTFVVVSEAKADRHADHAAAPVIDGDIYLPARFVTEERAAQEEAFPPQF